MIKRLFALSLAIISAAILLTSCTTNSDDNNLNIISVNFPGYDFARQIAGDKAKVSILLAPGEEAHSYEPSPKDVVNIGKCDLFIYTGDENDVWVDRVIDSVKLDEKKTLKMTDCVDLLDEELSEGMENEEEHEHEDAEKDPHVWTSPVNAIKICENICNALCNADPTNESYYKSNLAAYTSKLHDLDDLFKDVVSHATLSTIAVGERFPFRYLVEEYNIKYYAAFPGCASDTEPGAKTIAFLIDKVKEEKLPYVFYIEFSNKKTAETIASAAGAKTALLHSCHNVTKEEFDNGATYISLMTANAEVLRKALNKE